MDPRPALIEKRMSTIKRRILVASGKGGVGKSLIATTIALFLSRNGFTTGLLDLDLHGPTCHTILGITPRFPEEDRGVLPLGLGNLKFMSVALYVAQRPLPLRGTDLVNVIREILAITVWGELEFLIVDLPPGLGDELLEVLRLIPYPEAIIVTTPSKLAVNTVKKLLYLLKSMRIRIIGVIENMKTETSKLEYAKDMCKEMRVRYLGSIPFDPGLEASFGDLRSLMSTVFGRSIEGLLPTIIE